MAIEEEEGGNEREGVLRECIEMSSDYEKKYPESLVVSCTAENEHTNPFSILVFTIALLKKFAYPVRHASKM